MCLGIPGELIEIAGEEPLARMGKASFGGVVKEVCLAAVPEAGVGDYVIVHAGFAIDTLNEEEAQEVFDYLREIVALQESEPRPEQADEIR